MGPNETEFEVIRYPLVDSTNRIAFDLGYKNAAHGTFVLADEQSGGRGRQSRYFSSPRGGLYTSAILRPQLPVEDLALITLTAGVATVKAIKTVTGISIQLKWPNDLYVNDKKVGGILTEAAPYSQDSGNVPFVVVGIGLNVNTRCKSFPDLLQDVATSLYYSNHEEYDIDSLLPALMTSLLDEVSMLQKSRDEVLMHWRKCDFLLGRNISWQTPGGEIIHGSGNGLLPDGRYLLTTSGGDEYPVLAGDIIITGINERDIK